MKIIEDRPKLKNFLYFYKCLYGVKTKNSALSKFIVNQDFLKYSLINYQVVIKKIEETILYLKNKDLSKIYVMDSKKQYSEILKPFCQDLGLVYIDNRFKPGSFTNVELSVFEEPSAIFVLHDKKENQAITESQMCSIDVIGINNLSLGINKYNLCIPLNNFYHPGLEFVLNVISEGVLEEPNERLKNYFEKIQKEVLEKAPKEE